MKVTKLILGIALLSGAANAATITVSAGLTAQGVTPLVNSAAMTDFFVSVGTWDAGTSTFTSFGSVLADTAEVNGAFTATGPASFNSALIAIFVGKGQNISSSGDVWAVFSATANTAFPSDVTQATGVTFSMTQPSVLNVVGKGNAASGFVAGGVNTNNFNFTTVPEPSSLLLGALSALGLLRRRRN